MYVQINILTSIYKNQINHDLEGNNIPENYYYSNNRARIDNIIVFNSPITKLTLELDYKLN